MAKNRSKKQSKRQPARQRYKIEKKVRDHNKKVRREAKKNPKKNKRKLIQVPNICPFKDDILKEVELLKKQKEEEKQKLRELAKLEKQKDTENKKATLLSGGLKSLVTDAETRGNLHEALTPETADIKESENKTDQSLKQYYKEFRKVIEAADVILEVVDARDPLGTRCNQVEEAINKTNGAKRLVLVLNKADLVPRDTLESWLKYLKKQGPVVAFKASIQSQNRNLAQRKFNKTSKCLIGSASVGTELIMSLLANYCRNKGIKTSITVGVVGLPNVGKSSVINSLKRSRVCNVGASPGITRAAQIIQLDSKIKLLDSPGIVFSEGNDNHAVLKNAVKISGLADPLTPANAILEKVPKDKMMQLYDITNYESPEQFYSLKAARTGKFRKGGVPDIMAAARGLIEDWNSGKIPYCTLPPEENPDESSYKIVSEVGKEFDLDNMETMVTEALNNITKKSEDNCKTVILDALDPLNIRKSMKKMSLSESASNKISRDMLQRTRKTKKADPEMALEGNQKLNQLKKKQFKKDRRNMARGRKVTHIPLREEKMDTNADN